LENVMTATSSLAVAAAARLSAVEGFVLGTAETTAGTCFVAFSNDPIVEMAACSLAAYVSFPQPEMVDLSSHIMVVFWSPACGCAVSVLSAEVEVAS
jgi:hypothetical protein